MRILLVEDDFRLSSVVVSTLRRAGYEVTHVPTVADALTAPTCDLILLDLNLPDGDGLALCRRLRRDSDVPIIVLTARGDENARIAGLHSGADDYMVKPFSLGEMRARMDAVLRRARPRAAGVRDLGPLRVDLDGRAATVDEVPVPLTRKEFHLLALLAAEPGVVVNRDRLIAEVWLASGPGVSRSLDVHMARLRTKLGDAVRLETIRGVGYRITPARRTPVTD
ncbi:response regulator transcription factor [Virgisporangium ochraceum]|uniref:Sensory transduction protein RegX3 n=1 Tax=Virgisporangium ochraceum TaxID=65505 RepID=A0A8J3ZX83_9ACTN|nr:response regulator transcription factor [Virgisporangium ochraceum]GIJ70597.1 DNA-binding response regulator [Virgisporangium ochraceum]